VTGLHHGEVLLNPLFRFQEQEEREGRIIGGLIRVGSLKKVDKIQMAGLGEWLEKYIEQIAVQTGQEDKR
jgi:pilus assembly protein CpaF